MDYYSILILNKSYSERALFRSFNLEISTIQRNKHKIILNELVAIIKVSNLLGGPSWNNMTPNHRALQIITSAPGKKN